MKRNGTAVFVLLLLGFWCSSSLQAQSMIERKIIIENGRFYFFTVNEENQLATLHTGAVEDRLNRARKYPIPIGRERNDAFNPLCFDINGNTLIGINWILNSNNSRYDALKRIDLRDWKKARPDWTDEDWAQVSFDQPVWAPNIPWQQMLETNNVLEHCFFDLVRVESRIMAICNQGQLRIWAFGGEQWTPLSAPVPVEFTAYFSLISVKNATVGIIDDKGNVYQLDESAGTITKVKAGKETKPYILIVDYDQYKTYTISDEAVQASGFSTVKELIARSEEIVF